MHSVREKILELLKKWGEATVAELASELEMAAVSVRHHLDILQGDGLLCVDRSERKGNVGRPQQIYRLTPDANCYFPNNFPALASGLMRQLKQILPPDQVQVAFQSMAQELAQTLDEEDVTDNSFEHRLERVTHFLNEQGYLARWEHAGVGEQTGYLLHKYNCPYAGVSSEHRELCVMDQCLVDNLVGQSCCRTNSMVEDGHRCTYHIAPHQLPLDEIVLVG